MNKPESGPGPFARRDFFVLGAGLTLAATLDASPNAYAAPPAPSSRAKAATMAIGFFPESGAGTRGLLPANETQPGEIYLAGDAVRLKILGFRPESTKVMPPYLSFAVRYGTGADTETVGWSCGGVVVGSGVVPNVSGGTSLEVPLDARRELVCLLTQGVVGSSTGRTAGEIRFRAGAANGSVLALRRGTYIIVGALPGTGRLPDLAAWTWQESEARLVGKREPDFAYVALIVTEG